MMTKCPQPSCGTVSYTFQDLPIVPFLNEVSKYFLHHIQLLIDQAARHDVEISSSVDDYYTYLIPCKCGAIYPIKLPLRAYPDLGTDKPH